VISRCHRSRPICVLKNHRGAQSCVNSPAGFIRRKHNLGILEDDTELSQVLTTSLFLVVTFTNLRAFLFSKMLVLCKSHLCTDDIDDILEKN
jgi:hypothetical protein